MQSERGSYYEERWPKKLTPTRHMERKRSGRKEARKLLKEFVWEHGMSSAVNVGLLQPYWFTGLES